MKTGHDKTLTAISQILLPTVVLLLCDSVIASRVIKSYTHHTDGSPFLKLDLVQRNRSLKKPSQPSTVFDLILARDTMQNLKLRVDFYYS